MNNTIFPRDDKMHTGILAGVALRSKENLHYILFATDMLPLTGQGELR